MASIFRKPGNSMWWVTYNHKGKRLRHSLRTTDERAALKKLKKLEGELVTGELESKSLTPIVQFLEEFTGHLATARTRKSYKNDISNLRIFFGPICEALRPGSTRNRRFGPGEGSAGEDRFKGRHVEVKTLEQLSANVMSNFINTRITKDGISPKTANRMREVLHVLFNYAIRQHGFRSVDRRYPNPVDAVPRRREEEPVIRFLAMDQIDMQLKVLADEPVLKAMVRHHSYSIHLGNSVEASAVERPLPWPTMQCTGCRSPKWRSFGTFGIVAAPALAFAFLTQNSSTFTGSLPFPPGPRRSTHNSSWQRWRKTRRSCSPEP